MNKDLKRTSLILPNLTCLDNKMSLFFNLTVRLVGDEGRLYSHLCSLYLTHIDFVSPLKEVKDCVIGSIQWGRLASEYFWELLQHILMNLFICNLCTFFISFNSNFSSLLISLKRALMPTFIFSLLMQLNYFVYG